MIGAPRCRRRSDIQIGPAIRLVRDAVGITQEELGRRTGHARSRIAQWECGHRIPTLRHIAALAEALGIPAPCLIGIATGGR